MRSSDVTITAYGLGAADLCDVRGTRDTEEPAPVFVCQVEHLGLRLEIRDAENATAGRDECTRYLHSDL